jgi:hypothetical protein
MAVQKIALDRLVFLGNVPAGMDWSVVGYWACQFRKSGEPGPPILVVPIGSTGLFRVTDGRHRTIASYFAGRTEIVFKIDPDRPAEAEPSALAESFGAHHNGG